MLNELRGSNRRLDPYVSSSLLQKSIRRGEVNLAQEAAKAHHRHRGKGVWRRLLVIAFEDIGIGEATLVRHVTGLVRSRVSASFDGDVIEELAFTIQSMCAAAKNCGTDHLTCAAEALLTSRYSSSVPDGPSIAHVIDIAADPSRSLTERAAALIDTAGVGRTSIFGTLTGRLEALASFFPTEAADLVETSLGAYAILRSSFVLTLPLLVAARIENGSKPVIAKVELEEPYWVNGLPSYVFDKHTSVGKRAISIFARENAALALELAEFVLPQNRPSVACMATFHVDAVPLGRELVWSGSEELRRAGLEADMEKAGCPRCGIDPIIECVKRNLDHLNAIRSKLSGGGTSS